MNGQPDAQASAARPLRILEVGAHAFLKTAAPDQTDLLWTGDRPWHHGKSALGPMKFLRALASLRRGEYDLLVVNAPQYAPWHPRTFLTILRSWHVRAPLGLFASFAWRFIHLGHKVPMVGVDFSDSCLIGRHNFFLLRYGKAFYKRELPSDHWLVFCRSGYPTYPGRRWRTKKRYNEMVQNLRPVSFGHHLNDDDTGSGTNHNLPTEKSVDVFFSGAVTPNSTVRSAGLAELEALRRDGFVVDVPSERLSRPEFLKRMSKAWLAWSPAGLGWDCARHYEAPLVGTVPLINYPTILRDAPLVDGEHCIFYAPEPGGLVDAAKKALADKEHLREMALAAQMHVKQHHTVRARAERIAIAIVGRRFDGTPVGS